MNKTNTWEEAFGQMIDENFPEDEIKLRQREIQQQDWDNDLPNLGDTLDELTKIKKFLKENGYNYNDSPFETIKSIVDVNKRLAAQSERVRAAMSTL